MEFFAVFVVIVILGLLGIFFFANIKDAADGWKREVMDTNKPDKKNEREENDTYIDLGWAKENRIAVTFENADNSKMYRVFASESGIVVGRQDLGGED